MRRDTLLLRDMLKAINDIELFIKGKTLSDFMEDDMCFSAVARKLEIIGEASKNISEELKRSYEKIPWKEMAGLRDKLIHWYFGLDPEIIWEVCVEELPKVKPQIEAILEKVERKD